MPDRPERRDARRATDDEILGLESEGRVADAPPADVDAKPTSNDAMTAALDAHPELRRAWDDAAAYRETFATPEKARAATALLADLDRMDALFFSRRPEDHAELARAVARLDPEAFASLAHAMQEFAAETQSHRENPAGNRKVVATPPVQAAIPNPAPTSVGDGGEGSAFALHTENDQPIPRSARGDNTRIGDAPRDSGAPATPTPAQAEFFHAANAAAVQGVLDAIETQVDRLLPDGVSKSARNRVVGEIYRELDATLQSNRQLAQQMREAFRSGALDANHQRAIVSLITGRARQALPGVAKRVLNEWTSTIVAASQDRRSRQRAAERRVDIAGSGGAANDGRRPMAPRDLDYARLSDADILNL